MSVAKFVQPNMTTQDAATYKAAIDSAIAVLAKIGAGFAPRANDTPDMKVRVDPGVTFNRATGAFTTAASQQSATITAPGSNSKIVRIYVTEAGAVGKVEGATAASPVAPAYPAGVMPLAQVTIASSTTTITNAMLTDERAWNSGYGTPKNTFLIETSGTLTKPPGMRFWRLSACAAGAGAGGGNSAAADATKFGGGGGGGGACVLNRLFGAGNLTVVIGAGGVGGANALAAAGTAVDGTDGGVTTITGVTSGLVISCAAGVKGLKATAAANGTGGAGGAAGTGTAGTAGAAGVSNTNGGNGGGTGSGGVMSPGGAGAVLASTRTGSPGTKGSGGGGGCGFLSGGKGGDGGKGWVLVEVF